ncbi:membrane protein [Defluviimonas sp. 20V17]|uniref:Alkaline phosphatase n=1 Tax=Allgaiera indica TaxID=765699 RepID=A0AAN5A017_9RHOB|nr:VTT domain-containing protein [Allgaiera indica]KDB01834.1 membrane protein [Defluviimonas sp. 20V17]GHE02436.1 alkaline phosphatase [Allgaiera indica]SDX29963.1 membrane protein DedA, SNARE-associated domain [Allgaiera indica]
MISLATILSLVQAHGLLLLFLLAVAEGPIVSVIGAYLAKLGFMDVYAVFAVVVAADLIGDMLFYELGRNGSRWLSPKWQHRLRLDDSRIGKLKEHFRDKGGRTLVIGKITHSAGMLVLAAAGAAHMNVAKFLGWNLVATIPKSAFFVILGYSLGYAYKSIDGYLFKASMVMLALIVIAAVAWFTHRWMKRS